MSDKVMGIAVLAGMICIVVGWLWSMYEARKVNIGWLAAMAFFFIFTLPVFAFRHWDQAKRPVMVTVLGFALIIGFAALTALLGKK